MSAATLLAAAAVDVAVAGVLVLVAWVFRRRHEAREAGSAILAFQVWWAGLAFTVLVNGVKELVVALGIETSATVISFLDGLQFVYVAALCAAVGALLYYLVFLFTGHRGWLAPLAGFYALYGIVALAFLARMRPDGVVGGKWFVQWDYQAPAAGGPVFLILTLLLLLPQIAAAVAYLTLRTRVEDPAGRRRIALVGWALTLWLGITLLAPFVQLGRFEWWQAGGRLVGLVAALVILRAYLESGQAPSVLVEREGAMRREEQTAAVLALRERARELV